MKKIFLIVPSNNPSGGAKVANQIVNLFLKKGFESFLATLETEPKKASFLKEPAPVISLEDFKRTCSAGDIVITFWQHKEILAAIKDCPAKNKIFWQHGVIIPRYADFNGEEYFKPGIFTDYWNVSAACADYIKERYGIPEIKIVHPFFDDKTLLEYFQKKGEYKREGVLLLRRRGQEAISDIISLIPEQKITILPKTFSDAELYEQLIRHEFFISTDNGVEGAILIKNKLHRRLKRLRRILSGLLKNKDKEGGQNGWVRPKKNLLGFPVSACEAAWLGAVVIGFPMGGGLEWMNNDNMYQARDNDLDSLLQKTREALNENKKNLSVRKELALAAVKKFNQENTWKQISEYLNLPAENLSAANPAP
jgi:hypothetical protein